MFENKRQDEQVRKVIDEAIVKLKWITGIDNIRLAAYVGEKDKSPKAMMAVIASALDMEYKDIFNRTRSADLVELRRVCALCLFMLYKNISTGRIGELMGGYDHSTVSYLITVAQDYLQNKDETFTPRYDKAFKAAEQWLKSENL